MANPTSEPGSDASPGGAPIPEMATKRPRHGGAIPLSVIWIVPLLAVAITMGIAWKTYHDRGPLIEVSFSDASGLVAEQTALKFRSLKVGMVEKLRLEPDLTSVVAHIRVDKDVAPYIDDSAQFWIVQPEVSARGVTGLDTVLSGVFIQGSWDAERGPERRRFEGSSSPPLAPTDASGTLIVLRGDEGGRVSAGAPVVYRGVTVGEIDEPILAEDGSGVTANAFIRAPYDKLINSNTRFWGASGFSVNVGADGLNVNVANLAALIQGGITFGTVVSGGAPLDGGESFNVYFDEAAARESVFAEAGAREVRFSTILTDAVSGLTVGAPVELAGLRVGQVTDLGAFIDEADENDVKLRVDFSIRPGRIGLGSAADAEDVYTYIEDAVADGLFAQLEHAGIFSSDLKITLVHAEDQRPGRLDRAALPYPTLPAMPVDLEDVSATTEGVMDRLSALPIEDVLDGTVEMLDNLNRLMGQAATQQVPREALALLEDTRETVAALDPEPLMSEIHEMVAELRGMAADLGNKDNRDRVGSVLDKADALASQLEGVAEGLPALLASAQSVTDQAASLDLQELVQQSSATVGAIGDLAQAPETQALPGEIQGLVSETRSLIGAPETQALPGELNATLSATGDLVRQVQDSAGLAELLAALERVDRIAADLETSAATLPDLSAQASDLVARLEALPLDQVVGATEEFLDSANLFISSDDTAAVPAALSGALGEVEASLAELREGGAVENVNATLASTEAAARAVAQAAEDLPALSARLERLISEAEGLLATYGGGSPFNAQSLAAIHELRNAARAMTSLANSIERNPSMLIRGR